MPSRAVLIGALVLFVLLGVGAAAIGDPDAFTDDDDSVHEQAINALAGEQIVDQTECADRLFCPARPISRWVMAVWLVRAMGEEPVAGSDATRFADVESVVWWMPYVERLAGLGITSGCDVDPLRFCPDEPVTRGQMATFVARALGLIARADVLDRYTAVATAGRHVCALRADGSVDC